MKKIIIPIYFIITTFLLYSQTIQKNELLLNNYSFCVCLLEGYKKVGIKLNDSSIVYWRNTTFLSTNQKNELYDFITYYYIKNMELNQAWDGSTCVINHCLELKKDKKFIELKTEFLKDNKFRKN